MDVVLYWIGSKLIKKTDATFKRLHVALTKITGSASPTRTSAPGVVRREMLSQSRG